MRFLSLYVDAFGGLSKHSFDFSEGFSEILAENGAGKSTLAAFIKAMLYGLDGTGITRELTANEFALYRPWGGGRFGGSLTFATDEGTYRIERYFEDKRGANKHLGEYRVVDTATEMPTDAFGEEPGRVLFGVDGESFMRTAYLSSRGIMAAKTGDIAAKLGGLEGEAFDMSRAEDALRLIEKRRAEIRTRTRQRHGTKLLDVAERELNTTKDCIAEASAAMEAEARERSRIADIRPQLAEKKTRLEALTAKKQAADRQAGEEKAKGEQLAELSALLESDKAEIARISLHFPDAPPSPETLATLDAELSEYNLLTVQKPREEVKSEYPIPKEADIAELRALVKEREEAEKALAASAMAEPDGTRGGTGQAHTRLLVFGIILLFLLPPVGILLLCQRAKKRAKARALAALTARERAEGRLAEAKRATDVAFAVFGLPCDAGYAEIDALNTAMLTARIAAEERKKNAERADRLRERIEKTLSAYRDLPATDAIGVRVDALRGHCRALDRAQAMLIEHSTRFARLKAATPPPPNEAIAPEEIEKEIALLKEGVAEDTTAIAAATERAEGYRAIADGLDELYDRYEAQSVAVEELSERLSMLDKTAALLTEAKDAMEARCLGGIRSRIGAYTDRLLGHRFGEVRLNTDLDLAFSEGGEGHSADYFSTGLRAVGDICLRLALTDELYPKDPPPLILDDPFIALDESNLKKALTLLGELSRTRQILYLTCHPSRKGSAV